MKDQNASESYLACEFRGLLMVSGKSARFEEAGPPNGQ